MKKSAANAHRRVSIYAWRCAATEGVLFVFPRCGLRNCCPERSLNDRVTQMVHRSGAPLLCTHASPGFALPRGARSL